MSLPNSAPTAKGLLALTLTMLSLPVLISCGHGNSGNSAPGNPSIASLTVSPTTIVRGQSATLSWSTAGTRVCTGLGAWSGVQAATGSTSVSPTAEGKYTYSLQCFASTGTNSANQSVTLTVTGSAYSVTPLVSDMAGVATHQDANLVNPWGIVAGPPTPFWVANNGGKGTSTLYDGTGKPLGGPLVVALGTTFKPTGIVFNGTQDFKITGGTAPAPSLFIFSGEGGMLAGWNQSSATGVVTLPGSTGAQYTGLAMASAGGKNYLYATDFANSKIDVFDGTFALQAWPAKSFVDANLPSGYTPFGIQALTNGGTTLLYVTYAKKSGAGWMAGAGLGLVDVFDTSGTFKSRLIDVGGWLNEPWGVAWAPADFGTASSLLLVGNLADGTINEFDPTSGSYVGTVSDANNKPIAYPGLWGIAFGNDQQKQPHNTLFFAAGLNDLMDGLYGRIDLGATPPTL